MTQTNETPQAKDVAEQLGIIKDDVVRLAGMVGTIAAERAREAQTAAARYAEDAKEQASHTYAQTEASVRKNPALAVGVAAGVGFALARVVFRRRF